VGQAREREPVVTTDSDQAELGDGDNLLGGLGAQVGQLTALQIGPHALDRLSSGPYGGRNSSSSQSQVAT
jgi:hypothetical protein